ncbi:hypothetical protein PHLCEN_2v8280 [Hermanssonia centrifuga]|uniref:Uncharacterized protein n=1 Tax=Hermanssonia centrifuga TaxID=98765 RepID=A0A2R6NU35_9APHY|nr:hypothetical protein PHLCEN_2v8280 [Hermanssonia centrifuga]
MPAIAPMPPSPPAARSADGPDPRASVVSTSSNSSSSTSDSVSESERISSHTVMARTSSSSTATSVDSGSPRKNHHCLAYSYEEGTRIGGASALELFPVCDALDGHSLYMQLHRAVSMVLATREAMWEELKERIDHNRESLKAYGWEPSDFDEVGNKERGVSRQKFDALVERYKR